MIRTLLLGCFVALTCLTNPCTAVANGPVDIGSRRELFLDGLLIDRLSGGAQQKLHTLVPREKVLAFDRPWEGIYSGYITVLYDGENFRMYYRGLPVARHSLETETTCYAVSPDGIHWTKPNIGAFEVNGTRENNVILARNRGCHNFAPFIDKNPNVSKDKRYKALGGTGAPGLLAFGSADGVHWQQLQDEPVITKGAFDSQNASFWSESEQQYVCYFRVFRRGVRWIARSTSRDFIHWTEPVDMDFGDRKAQHLYTNQTVAYFRAPHIYIGLPTRFFPGRRVLTEQQIATIGTPKKWSYANDCADIAITTTRGGTKLDRTFMEAFVRPGLDARNWTSRANYAACGIVPTGKDELSIYISHNLGYPTSHVRRYSMRVDGFASINGPFRGGELLTHPLTFTGTTLSLNYATSAAGSLRVEIQDAAGKPIPGFSLDDCLEIIGDHTDRTVRWKRGTDVSDLSARPVRLRFELKDADIYSLQFMPSLK